MRENLLTARNEAENQYMNLFERYGTRFLEVLLECSPFGVISQRHLPVHRLPRHFGTNHFIVCQTVHLTVDHDAPS